MESVYVGKSMSSIAKRIRQLRESLEMSRPEFAREIGIPPRTLETLENRATSPREAVLKAVAEKYPEYCYWLLTGKVNSKVVQTKPTKSSGSA